VRWGERAYAQKKCGCREITAAAAPTASACPDFIPEERPARSKQRKKRKTQGRALVVRRTGGVGERQDGAAELPRRRTSEHQKKRTEANWMEARASPVDLRGPERERRWQVEQKRPPGTPCGKRKASSLGDRRGRHQSAVVQWRRARVPKKSSAGSGGQKGRLTELRRHVSETVRPKNPVPPQKVAELVATKGKKPGR